MYEAANLEQKASKAMGRSQKRFRLMRGSSIPGLTKLQYTQQEWIKLNRTRSHKTQNPRGKSMFNCLQTEVVQRRIPKTLRRSHTEERSRMGDS